MKNPPNEDLLLMDIPYSISLGVNIPILLIFLLLITLGFSQNPPSPHVQPSSAHLAISNIEINHEFIDYRRLSDEEYRVSLEHGEVLYEAIDSVVPFFNYPYSMELPHYLNTLSFQYVAIDWEAPHRITYSYYLEGLEKEWNSPKSTAKAMYENLPYGNYTFWLKAKTNTSIWSEPLKYSFSIQRAWWQTRIAKLIYLFSFGSLAYLIMQHLMEKAKEQDELRQLRKWYNESLVMSFPPKNTKTGKNEFLITVHQVLEEHLSDENFGIAELCESLVISRTQLYRKLKALTGKSTSHYIRFLRLTNAKRLLEETDLSVSEVAFKVGFSSHSYFSRVFKEEFGYAPSEIK